MTRQRLNLLKTRVILSGVPSGAKAGRNEVEEPVLSLPKESRLFRATPPVLARDPSTPLRMTRYLSFWTVTEEVDKQRCAIALPQAHA